MHRILDANWNRASEGARVVEDYARFILDDAHLCSQYKQLRHDLAAAAAAIGGATWWRARDSRHDAGADVSTPAERRRPDASHVWQASQKRLEQALRCLEEYSKTDATEFAPQLASEFEQLRYRAYALGRALRNLEFNSDRFARVRLYLLVDGDRDAPSLAQRCRRYYAAGADALQLRDKSLNDRELLARARVMAAVAQEFNKLAIINDRADIARLSGADGVHLGQGDLDPYCARRILGPAAVVGVSTHSLKQAEQAVLDGADYLGYGPVFASRSKDFAASDLVGPEFVQAAAGRIRLPAFAIGGIDLENLDVVLRTGVHGVAICGAVERAEDPCLALTTLRAALGQARASQDASSQDASSHDASSHDA